MKNEYWVIINPNKLVLFDTISDNKEDTKRKYYNFSTVPSDKWWKAKYAQGYRCKKIKIEILD